MSAGRGIQQGVTGAGGRGIGETAGRIGRPRDDGRLRGNAGASAGVSLLEGSAINLGPK
jgi:hypothetical protein